MKILPPFVAAGVLVVGLFTGSGTTLAGQESPGAPVTVSPPVQAAPAGQTAVPPPPSSSPGTAVPAQAGAPQAPAAPGSLAQPAKNADGTYTIRRSSRLVVLDVVVTDKQGNLVTDLTKGDFNVTEAKEPQTIQNFEATGTRGLTATGACAPGAG